MPCRSATSAVALLASRYDSADDTTSTRPIRIAIKTGPALTAERRSFDRMAGIGTSLVANGPPSFGGGSPGLWRAAGAESARKPAESAVSGTATGVGDAEQ